MARIGQDVGQTELAILDVEVRDAVAWQLSDLVTFCQQIDELYRKMGIVVYLEQHRRDAKQLASIDESIRHSRQFRGERKTQPGEEIESLSNELQYSPVSGTPRYSHVVPELLLNGIEIHSPGWVEIIGGWNPLKLLADFITKYREENTERIRMGMQERLIEQRIKADLIVSVLERLPHIDPTKSPNRGKSTEALWDVVKLLSSDIADDVSVLANNHRIEKVEVRPHLPKSGGSS